MVGSKTRPGFAGSDEPPPSNPEEEISPHASRTMLGRAIHSRVPADSGAAPTVPPIPPEEAPEIAPGETTEEPPSRPSHSGKTKFPAFARLFGRWTTGGGFHSRSELSADDDDLSKVPREVWASRLAIFALAALFSFLAALAALNLHRCSPSVSRPSSPAAAAAPASPPSAAASTAAAILPAAVPAALPTAASCPPLVAAPVAPATPPAAARRQATDRPAMRAGSSSTRAAPGATGKPRTPPARPRSSTSSKENADFLLPFGL